MPLSISPFWKGSICVLLLAALENLVCGQKEICSLMGSINPKEFTFLSGSGFSKVRHNKDLLHPI